MYVFRLSDDHEAALRTGLLVFNAFYGLSYMQDAVLEVDIRPLQRTELPDPQPHIKAEKNTILPYPAFLRKSSQHRDVTALKAPARRGRCPEAGCTGIYLGHEAFGCCKMQDLPQDCEDVFCGRGGRMAAGSEGAPDRSDMNFSRSALSTADGV